MNQVQVSEKIERAENLLNSLELTKNLEKETLLKALSEAKSKPQLNLKEPIIELPCGDAKCKLTDQGDQSVTVSYDFAL